MAKRSVTNEIQIAALSAALELVGRPDYSRGWLKDEFADRHINAVRVTGDIVVAVEDAMTERLTRLTKILQAELDEALAADESDEVKPEFAGADIEIVDFIGNLHDESKTSETSGIFPAGSKIARAEQAANATVEDEFVANFHAQSREFYAKSIEAVMDEEVSKGNEVNEVEALAILQRRFTVGLRETD